MARNNDNGRRRRIVTAAALLLLALPGVGRSTVLRQHPDAAPRTPPPSIQGQLFDSTQATALGDARIILWNTPHETCSASDGSFTFLGLEAGDYSLVYFHPRLTALGLSSGAHAVQVSEGAPADLFLATPSMLSIQATLCTMDRGGVGEGELVRVAGQVLDADTGFPLGGVPVEASWNPTGERSPMAERAFTDPEGWYRLCGVAPGVPVGVRRSPASVPRSGESSGARPGAWCVWTSPSRPGSPRWCRVRCWGWAPTAPGGHWRGPRRTSRGPDSPASPTPPGASALRTFLLATTPWWRSDYVDNIRSVDPQGAIEIPAEVVDRMILFRPVEAGVFGLGAGSGVLLIFTKSGVRR